MSWSFSGLGFVVSRSRGMSRQGRSANADADADADRQEGASSGLECIVGLPHSWTTCAVQSPLRRRLDSKQFAPAQSVRSALRPTLRFSAHQSRPLPPVVLALA